MGTKRSASGAQEPASGAQVPWQFREPGRARAITRVAESFASLLGKPLIKHQGDVIAAMWNAPQAILAHGTEHDPLFFFGNRYALELFGYGVETFLRTPSRLSANAPVRAERQTLLERVAASGFIEDYAGTRVKADGSQFRIEQAIVWNVLDPRGERLGQAATFVV